MDQTNTIRSVNTELIYAVLSCHFTSNTKYVSTLCAIGWW